MMAKNTMPQPRMPRPIDFEMMKSEGLRGLSFITSREGGNEARAMAAKVSMIRLTQRICVTVSGISVPMMLPPRTSNRALTLTTSWKKRNR